MTFVITEPCIGTKDSACVDVCPVDCIHPDQEGRRVRVVRDALHRPGRVHRLRRVRAGLPRRGDLRGGRGSRQVEDYIEKNAAYYKK